MQQRLTVEINTVLTALAQQRGVQYVLNQDAALVLAPSGANWTAEVLQRLNALTAEQKAAADKSAPEKSTPAPKAP